MIRRNLQMIDIKELDTTTQLLILFGVFIALLMLILFILIVYSIIKTQTNTRILTEQNEQIILQNNIIIGELKKIEEQQFNTYKNEYDYMNFMVQKQG